jgi:hypothetical protein
MDIISQFLIFIGLSPHDQHGHDKLDKPVQDAKDELDEPVNDNLAGCHFSVNLTLPSCCK